MLIHEQDEVLEDYQLRIENYVEKRGSLPPVAIMDETIVKYTKSESLSEPVQHILSPSLKFGLWFSSLNCTDIDFDPTKLSQTFKKTFEELKPPDPTQ